MTNYVVKTKKDALKLALKMRREDRKKKLNDKLKEMRAKRAKRV